LGEWKVLKTLEEADVKLKHPVMEECLHSWRIVGGICRSLMEVHGQGSPRRCGCLGGAG